MSRYDDLQTVLRWCKKHNMRRFTFYEVGVDMRSLKGLWNRGFRRKRYLNRIERVTSRDTKNGLWLYELADWVDIDEEIFTQD